MTNTDIRRIINEANDNKNIRWSIVKNTDTEIVLTNDYDKSINYTITVKHQDGEEWIVARDNLMNRRVAMLTQGMDVWDDYFETENGIRMAIQAAVQNFNETY